MAGTNSGLPDKIGAIRGKSRARDEIASHLFSAACDPAAQTRRSTIIFLISAIAFAGLRPFGQACAQFMIVWQR
jgi:hypothetical protein